MSKRLFEVEGGFSDGNIHYLSGSGLPGVSQITNDAPVGSRFFAADGLIYRKGTAGSGTDKWLREVKSEKMEKELSQTAHGFVQGDWVYRDSSGAYVKGQADDPATSDVIGVVESVADVDNFTIVTSGYTSIASAEDDGSPLFLSTTTAGASTVTKPSEGVQKNLGYVIDGFVFVAIGLSVEIATDEIPGVPLYITDAVTTIETVAQVETQVAPSVMWLITATSTAGRFTCMIVATHDGIGADASNAEWTMQSVLEAGAAITGLAFAVSLTGTGAAQAMILTAVSTDEIDVNVRQMRT